MTSRFDLRESDNVFSEFKQFKQERFGIAEAESDKLKEHSFQNQGAQTSGAEIPSAGAARRSLIQHKLPPLITSVPVMEIRRTCDAIIAKNESRGYHNVSFLRVDQLQNVKPTLNGINSSKPDITNGNAKESSCNTPNRSAEQNFFGAQATVNSSSHLGLPIVPNGYSAQNLTNYGLNCDRPLSHPITGQPLMYRDANVESSAFNPNQVSNAYPHCSYSDNMMMSVVNPTTVLSAPCLTCQSAAYVANDNTVARPQDVQQSQCKELVQPVPEESCCHSRSTCCNKPVEDKCQCWWNQAGPCTAYQCNPPESACEEDCCCTKRNSCRSHFKCETKSNVNMHEECSCSKGENQNHRNWKRRDSGCWAYPCYGPPCCSRRNSCCDCESYSLAPSSSNSLCLAPYDPRQVSNQEVAQNLPNFNSFVNEYPIQDLLEALKMNQMALSIGVRPGKEDLPDDYKCSCEKDRFCENPSERALWIHDDEPMSRYSRTSMRSHHGRRMATYDMSSDENEVCPSETKILPFPSQTSRKSSRHKLRRPLKKIVVDWGDKNQYEFCHDLDGLTDNHCNCGISNRIKAKRKGANRCSMKYYENYR